MMPTIHHPSIGLLIFMFITSSGQTGDSAVLDSCSLLRFVRAGRVVEIVDLWHSRKSLWFEISKIPGKTAEKESGQ